MPTYIFFLFSEHVFTISKIDFFEEWIKHEKENRNSHMYEYLSARFDLSAITAESQRELNVILASYSSKMADKWSLSKNMRERFFTKNKDWLLEGAEFQFSVQLNTPRASTPSGAGRPRKSFDNLSYKSKIVPRRVYFTLVCIRDTTCLLLFISCWCTVRR